MKLKWYKTAAVMLESEGYRLVFDPFLGMPLKTDPVLRASMSGAFRSADAVLVTHGHFDHIRDIPRIYQNSDIEIYATKTPCKTLRSRGVEMKKLRCIAPGAELTLGGFTVRVYQGRHCTFDFGVARKTIFKSDTLLHLDRLIKLWRLNKRYPENGETLFYEIEAEGKRVQLMGSMGLDMTVDYPTGADVLILPFQGTGNPSATVAPIIERLQPKAICLDHYDDTFPPLSSQVPTVGFMRKMTARGIPTAALRYGRIYTI